MPSTTRSRATRERRDEVARRVLDAVHALVADGTPYTELPVQRIAAAAGVARSTLYLHFPDKSRLLIALADQGGEAMFGAALAWWRADHDDGPAGVEAAMTRMLAEYRAHLWVLLALSEVAAYDADVAAYYHARLARFTEVVRLRLEADQRAGSVPADLDPPTTATLLTWTVERTISVHCRTAGPEADPAMAATLARSIWLVVHGAP